MNAPTISTKSTPCRRFFHIRTGRTRESVIVFPPDADADGDVRPATTPAGTRHYPDSGPSIMGAFWALSEMKVLNAPEITEAEAREILGNKFPETTN